MLHRSEHVVAVSKSGSKLRHACLRRPSQRQSAAACGPLPLALCSWSSSMQPDAHVLCSTLKAASEAMRPSQLASPPRKLWGCSATCGKQSGAETGRGMRLPIQATHRYVFLIHTAPSSNAE